MCVSVCVSCVPPVGIFSLMQNIPLFPPFLSSIGTSSPTTSCWTSEVRPLILRRGDGGFTRSRSCGVNAARLKEASFECWAIIGSLLPVLGHAHLTDFNIATIIKDGERATALAGTKPYMGTGASPPKRPLMTRLLVSFLSEADPIFASLRREEVV